jgi:transcriptional regulator of acetoin/glycerol metabolism
MLALSEGKVLRLADFDPKLIEGGAAAPSAAASAAGENVLGAAESSALRSLLESVRWNVSAAAARLRISRRTLYRKMSRHGIARDAPAAHESDRNPV